MSEENVASNEGEEQVEGQEAVASDDEQASAAGEQASEPTVPLHEHTALRGRAQKSELEAAELRGQLGAMKQMQSAQAPAIKSPLEIEIERQTELGIDEEDMTVSPAIIRKEQLHGQQLANKAAEETSRQQLAQLQLASINEIKAVNEDFQAVIDAGEGFLTAGENLDIKRAGNNCGELLYNKCKAAIAAHAPQPEKTKVAPEKEKEKPSEKEAVVKTQEEILAEMENLDAATAAALRL